LFGSPRSALLRFVDARIDHLGSREAAISDLESLSNDFA
jgi:hypothetical protein